MSLEDIVEDSYGQTFEVTITQDGTAYDIASFTEAQTFLFKDPTGEVTTKTGDFSTDGTDGKVSFTVEAGDFDSPGIWKVQVYLEGPSEAIRTGWKAFKVQDSLNS